MIRFDELGYKRWGEVDDVPPEEVWSMLETASDTAAHWEDQYNDAQERLNALLEAVGGVESTLLNEGRPWTDPTVKALSAAIRKAQGR